MEEKLVIFFIWKVPSWFYIGPLQWLSMGRPGLFQPFRSMDSGSWLPAIISVHLSLATRPMPNRRQLYAFLWNRNIHLELEGNFLKIISIIRNGKIFKSRIKSYKQLHSFHESNSNSNYKFNGFSSMGFCWR